MRRGVLRDKTCETFNLRRARLPNPGAHPFHEAITVPETCAAGSLHA